MTSQIYPFIKNKFLKTLFNLAFGRKQTRLMFPYQETDLFFFGISLVFIPTYDWFCRRDSCGNHLLDFV